MSFLFDPDVIDEIGRRHIGKPIGSRIFVDRWQAATIHFPDHCWMLEYARGSLFALLPFGLANTFFNTLDWKSALRTLRVYGSLTRRTLAARRSVAGLPA